MNDERGRVSAAATSAFEEIERRCSSGFLYATASTVAGWSGVSPDTARTVVAELVASGHLVPDGRRYRLVGRPVTDERPANALDAFSVEMTAAYADPRT